MMKRFTALLAASLVSASPALAGILETDEFVLEFPAQAEKKQYTLPGPEGHSLKVATYNAKDGDITYLFSYGILDEKWASDEAAKKFLYDSVQNFVSKAQGIKVDFLKQADTSPFEVIFGFTAPAQDGGTLSTTGSTFIIGERSFVKISVLAREMSDAKSKFKDFLRQFKLKKRK